MCKKNTTWHIKGNSEQCMGYIWQYDVFLPAKWRCTKKNTLDRGYSTIIPWNWGCPICKHKSSQNWLVPAKMVIKPCRDWTERHKQQKRGLNWEWGHQQMRFSLTGWLLLTAKIQDISGPFWWIHRDVPYDIPHSLAQFQGSKPLMYGIKPDYLWGANTKELGCTSNIIQNSQ